MSLRALIEGKTRRTAVLPIQVGDTAAAAADVAVHRAALELHLERSAARGDTDDQVDADETTARLRAQVASALERQAATVVLVQLQALEPAVFDAVLDGIEPDEDGHDLTGVRAALLAESCTDPELRDEAWWTAQLASPTWSKGDLLAVNQLLLQLNLNVPAGAAGKG